MICAPNISLNVTLETVYNESLLRLKHRKRKDTAVFPITRVGIYSRTIKLKNYYFLNVLLKGVEVRDRKCKAKHK